MNVNVPHQLGRDEAIMRLQNLLKDMKQQYGDKVTDLQENWTDAGGTFSMKAMGFKLSGTLDVTDTEMKLDGELPWAAKPFQGSVETTIRERAERLLQ
ncbi:MAG: polyhydroxyalkanoic acid system family protein [Thermomicrobiales bacterium]